MDISDTYDFAPLHRTILRGNSKAVQLLLERGNDNPNCQTKDGVGPLIFAAAHGMLDSAAMLLEKNTDGNLATHTGDTPLRVASEKGEVEMVRLLLWKGGDVNLKIHTSPKKGFPKP